MEFRVVRLRLEGRTIPNWERGSYDVQGPLLVEERHSEELHRYVRVATIVGKARQGTPVKLELFDPVLVYATSDLWVMTGFERFEVGNRTTICHLQSWWLMPLTESMLREDEWMKEQEEWSRQYSEVMRNFVGPPVPPGMKHRRRR